MSVLLNKGLEEYLFNNNAILTETPISMSCWFKPLSLDTNKSLISICDGDNDLNYFKLWALRTESGQTIRVDAREVGGLEYAISASQYVNNVWQHAGAVFSVGDLYRQAFLNGVGGEGGWGSCTPAGLDRTGIGVTYRLTISDYMSGYIAEVGIWDCELTDNEMASLGKGFSPLLIRPQNLVAYWPLIREGAAGVYVDRVGGKSTSEANGSTPAPHPRVIYPQVSQMISIVSLLCDFEDITIDSLYGFEGITIDSLQRFESIERKTALEFAGVDRWG